MSDKPSAAWYLAPIFLGIIGSAIMWYVLKDEDHPDAPKMVRKGWIIGIILTVIEFAWWIPFLLIPFAFMGFDDQQMQQQMEQQTQQQIGQQALQQAPQQTLETVPSENICDPSYPEFCIPPYPPDLDCGEIQFANFKVLQPDPHGFDADNDGIGCESGSTQPSTPIQQQVPAPGFEDVPEMIVESENNCDPSYPDVCIPAFPPDLDCGEIQFANFKVLPPDPHRFDGDKDGIGCES